MRCKTRVVNYLSVLQASEEYNEIRILYVFKASPMHKKLTITIDEQVYDSLHKTIGRGNISQFIESLVRPQVLDADIEDGYRQMALDEAREAEALEWAEATGSIPVL
jgi:hypothetical protein